MNDREPEWFDKLRNTGRCRAEVQEAAGWFRGLESVDYEDIIRGLIGTGEDRQLGILLNICSVNRVRIEPRLLAETLKVVEPLTDLAPPYRDQDEASIAPLLEAAESEDISWERQAYAARLAAELTVRFGCDQKPVKLVLNRLSVKFHALEAELLVQDSLKLLEKGSEDRSGFMWETQRDALSSLPEERPPVVIGGSFSVRRPVPKLGRNAPCHCGSGKKYKKCCYEKDQDLLRDASPYDGVTMTQARTTPGLVEDEEIIESMRSYELKKLNPSALGRRQLFAAYRRCDLFGMRQNALDMLLELRDRTPQGEFDYGHMEDLMDSALNAGDLALAEKIREQIPEGEVFDPEAVRLRFEILEGRQKFELLEARCRKAIVNAAGPDMLDDPLIELSYNFEKTFPAMSIVFSRAAIAGDHGSPFDRETLLDALRNARGRLDLDPWSDPIEEYFLRMEDESLSELDEEAAVQEIGNLRSKLEESRRAAAEKEAELRKRESELSRLEEMLERMGRLNPEKNAAPTPSSEVSPEERSTIQRLRRQIESLKGEVRSQQQERRYLREQLQKAKVEAFSKQDRPSPQSEDFHGESRQNEAIKVPYAPKRVLIPEFTPAFRRSCEGVPAPIAVKALRAAAGFGVNDVQVLRQTKRIERIPDLFRIRIDLRYRLLVRPRPPERLEVLDLLPRAGLETWIKQHAHNAEIG